MAVVNYIQILQRAKGENKGFVSLVQFALIYPIFFKNEIADEVG